MIFMADRQDTVERLLKNAGHTHADRAGITLENTPAPLYGRISMNVPAAPPGSRRRCQLSLHRALRDRLAQ